MVRLVPGRWARNPPVRSGKAWGWCYAPRDSGAKMKILGRVVLHDRLRIGAAGAARRNPGMHAEGYCCGWGRVWDVLDRVPLAN